MADPLALVRANEGGALRGWMLVPVAAIDTPPGRYTIDVEFTGFEKRTYEPVDDIDKVSCRPNFAIAAYSGYLKAKDKDELAPGLRVPKDTPPIFLVHGGADIISSPEHSVFMYLALKRAGSDEFQRR